MRDRRLFCEVRRAKGRGILCGNLATCLPGKAPMRRAAVSRLAGTMRRRLSPGARVGVDLEEIEPFRARLDGREDLLRRGFTDDEISCARARRCPWVHLAARFAAKGAILKAIGCGLAGAMGWREVEVCRDPAGEPFLTLSGEVARRAEGAVLDRFAVSLTHDRWYAVALVLAFSDQQSALSGRPKADS